MLYVWRSGLVAGRWPHAVTMTNGRWPYEGCSSSPRKRSISGLVTRPVLAKGAWSCWMVSRRKLSAPPCSSGVCSSALIRSAPPRRVPRVAGVRRWSRRPHG
jgi:hypothetical protein